MYRALKKNVKTNNMRPTVNKSKSLSKKFLHSFRFSQFGLIMFLSILLLNACQSKNTKPATPPPTVDERIGIYKNATVYAGSTDYEFEVDGKSILLRLSNFDTLNQPIIPSNLTITSLEGPPSVNPVLIGAKYRLAFGPQERLNSIKLLEDHDPSSLELPAIPENYSGLLAIGPSDNSRCYLSLASDLSAILLISYGEEDAPIYKYGRWTRIEKGQKVSVQFGEEEWLFLVKDNSLVLISKQMGSAGLTIMANEQYTICHYVQQWLSILSEIDGEEKIKAEDINNKTPLSDILRTEHAYMGLYGDLETVFKIKEKNTSETLRANPTVGGVCSLILQNTVEGH